MHQPFIEALQNALLSPPGEEAQYRMAPILRRQRVLANWPIKDARQSAVLILLYPKASTLHTVLMKRTEDGGVHSGQVSFPGGKHEHGDDSFEHTALRESEEEIGIQGGRVRILGKLSELYVPASHFNIHPYVGYSIQEPVFRLDPIEVAGVLSTPLDQLFDDRNKAETDIPLRNGLKLKAPYYDVDGHQVWGATAMIISELEVAVSNLAP